MRCKTLPSIGPSDKRCPSFVAGAALHKYGHILVRKLLARDVFDPALRGAPWVAQFSSLGSIGREWLAELQASFCAGKCAGDQPGSVGGARLHTYVPGT